MALFIAYQERVFKMADGEVRVEITGDSAQLERNLDRAEDSIRNTADEVGVFEDALESAGESTEDTVNYMEALLEAVRDVSRNTADMAESMEEFGEQTERTNEKTTTFGDLLKSNIIGELVADGLQTASAAMSDFVKQGVELASNLQEVQNVVDTTFGDGAQQIYDWADAAAESFGMSSLQAQNFNGTLGAMLKSMGLADDAVMQMSTDMVGLAGDMASFYNLDVSAAFDKIRAGISGETEPLKQLGINMSVANLEAYALANGIETAYEKMSQAEQAQLRYNYLMSVTADAQGDFAKTSDSFANQQRILQLNIENLSATLGQALLPHLNETITLINGKLPEAAPVIEKISGALGEMLGFLIDNHEAVLAFVGGLASISVAATYPKIIASLNASLVSLKNTLATVNFATVGAVAGIAALITAAVALKDYIDDAAEEIETVAPMDGLTASCLESIEVMKKQREEFDKLTADMKSTEAAETAQINKMQSLWEELQNYVDENGRVIASNERASEIIGLLNNNYDMNIGYINGQIQGYSELAGSMDGYIEQLRTEARIRSNQPIYDEAVNNIDKVKERLEELKNEEAVKLEAFVASEGTGEQGMFGNQVVAIRNEMDELEKLVTEYETVIEDYENLFSPNSLHGSDYGVKSVAQLQAEEYAAKQAELAQEMLDAKTKATEKMQTAWKNLEHQYAVGEIKTEEELYRQKREIWDKYGDAAFEDHWSFYEELTQYDKDCAEEQQKLAEKAAEERQKLAEEQAKKEAEAFEDLYEEQKDIVNEGLSDIIDEYEEAYKDLAKKKEEYSKKLMSIGGELFTVDVTKDENGNDVTTYTVNNLEEQLRKMREYHRQITELKNQGASEALLSEINTLGTEESTQFAKYLSSMSEAEFAEINKLYSEKQALADELSADLYKSEAQEISDSMTAALAELANNSADYGAQAADSYVDAFISEFDERYEEIADLLENTNIGAQIVATVEAETAYYSAKALTSPAHTEDTSSSNTTNSKFDLERIVEELNKPIQIVLDGKVLAESTMKYQSQYNRQTGG